MGWYVHIHVCFSCDRNDPVAAIAKRHLLPEIRENREAGWFLEDLAARTGWNPGPKGGLLMWGMTGNFTEVDKFVEVLRPFWLELYRTHGAGPLYFEHILVFEEQEQSEKTTAYEISYDEKTDALTVRKHACPFAFMQM